MGLSRRERSGTLLRVPFFSLLLAGVVAGVVMLVFALGPGRPDGALGQTAYMAQAGLELAIDADADNGKGPCDPIDAEAFVEEGATHRIAVCVLNPPKPPFAFFTQVIYDGQLNVAPDVPSCTSPALDCNPDANAGATTFSSPNLGARWDCTGLTVFPPVGDDPYTPEQKDASMACNTDLRDPDTTLVGSGPLEVITLKAIGRGDDHLELSPETHIAGEAGVTGRCGLILAETIPCRGAVIHNGETSHPTTAPSEASPGALTPSGTSVVATREGATPAVSQVTPEEAHGEGFPWAPLGGAVGGLIVLTAVVAGLYAWRRGAKGRT